MYSLQHTSEALDSLKEYLSLNLDLEFWNVEIDVTEGRSSGWLKIERTKADWNQPMIGEALTMQEVVLLSSQDCNCAAHADEMHDYGFGPGGAWGTVFHIVW